VDWDRTGIPSQLAVGPRDAATIIEVEKEITFRGFPTLAYAMTREERLAKHGAG
jgi:hypothetical protein